MDHAGLTQPRCAQTPRITAPASTPRHRLNRSLQWNRYYHAQLGRFVTRDPIGYVDGFSLYLAYFAPKGVDPYGLKCDCKPTKKECDDILNMLDNAWLEILNEVTNGEDISLREAVEKAKVLATAAGHRSKELEKMPCWFQEVVDEFENSWILTSTSIGLWLSEWIYQTVPFPKDAFDSGNGDVWLTMELWRMGMMGKRVRVLCRNAK